jgi:hypothetical protein
MEFCFERTIREGSYRTTKEAFGKEHVPHKIHIKCHYFHYLESMFPLLNAEHVEVYFFLVGGETEMSLTQESYQNVRTKIGMSVTV